MAGRGWPSTSMTDSKVRRTPLPSTGSTFLMVERRRTRAPAGTGRDEADLVGAVVHAARALGHLEQLRHHPREEREREIAVGDGLAARQLALGALDVHVDPLMVAGGLGELVDRGLVHRDPGRRAQRLPDVLARGPAASRRRAWCLLVGRLCGRVSRKSVSHRRVLRVPVGARLIRAARGEQRVLLPRAAEELEARGQPAVAEAVGDDEAGEPRAIAHRAHDVARGAAHAARNSWSSAVATAGRPGATRTSKRSKQPVRLARHDARGSAWPSRSPWPAWRRARTAEVILGRGEAGDAAALDEVLEGARRLRLEDDARGRLPGQIGQRRVLDRAAARAGPSSERSNAARMSSLTPSSAPASTPKRNRRTPGVRRRIDTRARSVVGSAGSAPAMASSTRPQSSAVRASGPSLSSVQHSAIAPCRLTRP